MNRDPCCPCDSVALRMAFRTVGASMDTASSRGQSATDGSLPGERLDSWKEIATYLKRSVRTVHRWEKEEGLPVHRQLHKDLGSVFAYKSELDAWSSARSLHAGPREETDHRVSTKPSRMIVAAALVATVVFMGAIAYLARRRAGPARSGQDAPVAGLELLSTFAGSHRSPAFSPDGRMVAFVSDAGGTPQVWIKDLATGNPIQITFGDVPAVRPRWSAQGDRIVYSRRDGGIWSVAPSGGEPRQILKDGRHADLSPDGRQLVFERARQIFIARCRWRWRTPVAATAPAADRALWRQLADLLAGWQVDRGLPRRTGPIWRLLDRAFRRRRASASHVRPAGWRCSHLDARWQVAGRFLGTIG